MGGMPKKVVGSFLANLKNEYLANPYFQNEFKQDIGTLQKHFALAGNFLKPVVQYSMNLSNKFVVGFKFGDFIISRALHSSLPIDIFFKFFSHTLDFPTTLLNKLSHSILPTTTAQLSLPPLFNFPFLSNSFISKTLHDYLILSKIEQYGVAKPLQSLFQFKQLECANQEVFNEFINLRNELYSSSPYGSSILFIGTRDAFVKDIKIENLTKTIITEFKFTVQIEWKVGRETERYNKHYNGHLSFIKRDGEWKPSSFKYIQL